MSAVARYPDPRDRLAGAVAASAGEDRQAVSAMVLICVTGGARWQMPLREKVCDDHQARDAGPLTCGGDKDCLEAPRPAARRPVPRPFRLLDGTTRRRAW